MIHTIVLLLGSGYLSAITGSLSFADSLAQKPSTALIYRGSGGCDSCAEASADMIARMGYATRFVSPKDLRDAEGDELFHDVAIWIQPAGNAIKAAKAIGSSGLAQIREFVREGGAYVGFCSGAFLSDSVVDDDGKVKGLGIIPVSTADYEVNSKDNIDLVWMNWSGKDRLVFFNGGATFVIPPQLPELNNGDLKILATYKKTGKPATIQARFGKGIVVVSGAHPEAPLKWKNDHGLNDVDGPDGDLARDMVTIGLLH